ncbi:MAG: PEP/pyruvate-binding domain-containing protein, partial [Candidatus Firestonebacteria bacterium]
MKKYIYYFGEGKTDADPKRKDILGGKGASLAEMSREGLPVPPGFIISAECCKYYFENKEQWTAGLEAELRENMEKLEQVTKRKYGSGKQVLLVSVRSGAAVSMPGMMDTILNCGLTPELALDTGDTPQFWRVYIQFVMRFARIVAGLKPEDFGPEKPPSKETALKYLEIYRQKSGKAFP